jgi:hypothetical protein
MGAIPAFGASIADDLVIKPAAQLQLRAQLGAGGTANLANAAGDDSYNIYSGSIAENDALRFSLRRARFGVSAKNSTGWDAAFLVRAGERADAGTGASSSQPVQLYYANVGKAFKAEAIEHRVHFGLDKPFNGESTISSSTYLFPNDRAVANLIEYRGIGAGYTVKTDFLKFGFDLANGGSWSNFGASKAAGTIAATGGGTAGGLVNPTAQGVVNSTGSKAGLFYSARIEFAPGAEYMPTKKMETFAGAEGTHVVIGFDIQSDNKDVVGFTAFAPGVPAKTVDQTTQIMGPDALVHWNSLTGLIDYRLISVKQSVDGGVAASNTAADDVKGSAFGIQAGYAIPMDAGFALEPAVRFHKVDLNKDIDEGTLQATSYANGEWQAGRISGNEFDIGLNFYWNGNANKTQIEYSNWSGEDAGPAAASATIPAGADKVTVHVFTIQHQVTF